MRINRVIFIAAAAAAFIYVPAYAATTESLDAMIRAQMSGGTQQTESVSTDAGQSGNEAMRAIEEQQARMSR
ncbi:MAG: hypothetical protein IKT09_06315, partial [Synergistes sp.]|nr:hypothetical protein [Synergistes sp.]